METMRVLGLDLSLTSTGVAHGTVNEDGSCSVWSMGTLTSKRRGAGRLVHLRQEVMREVDDLDGDVLVAIEGYAHARGFRAHQMGELGGVIRAALWGQRVPTIIVTPTALKRFATGKGNASKEMMVSAAARKADRDFGSSDAADAFHLAHFAAAVLVGDVSDLKYEFL